MKNYTINVDITGDLPIDIIGTHIEQKIIKETKEIWDDVIANGTRLVIGDIISISFISARINIEDYLSFKIVRIDFCKTIIDGEQENSILIILNLI